MSPLTRVLVVDDEDYVRESLQEMLAGEGFEVLSASDAGEAARVLGEERVDVVVSDLRMPSGDGLELLAATRQREVPVPVIVVTGVGSVADAVEAMRAGAFDLLQ